MIVTFAAHNYSLYIENLYCIIMHAVCVIVCGSIRGVCVHSTND